MAWRLSLAWRPLSPPSPTLVAISGSFVDYFRFLTRVSRSIALWDFPGRPRVCRKNMGFVVTTHLSRFKSNWNAVSLLLFLNLNTLCSFHHARIAPPPHGDSLPLPCLYYPVSSASPSGWFSLQTLFSFSSHGILMLLLPSGIGVGGLTHAFALSISPNIRVDVYEAASKFTEIGAGISVWWRTRQVLKSLGLEEDVNRLLIFRPGQDRGEPRDT